MQLEPEVQQSEYEVHAWLAAEHAQLVPPVHAPLTHWPAAVHASPQPRRQVAVTLPSVEKHVAPI